MKTIKDDLVLTVESELGAGGGVVAEALARKLKLRCRTGEILPAAARLSGISLKLLRRYEERPVRHAYDLTSESEAELRIPPAQDFLAAQIAACRSLAEQGPCVLAEHHANVALADREDHVGIFLHAAREERLKAYARERGLDPAQAARSFAREDRQRSRYYRSVSPGWGKSASYDLSVNSAAGTPEVLAEHILRYLETVSRVKPDHHPGAKAQRLIKRAEIVYLEAYRRRTVAPGPLRDENEEQRGPIPLPMKKTR